MSSSSTGVSTSEDQAQPTETESRLRELIATAEALDAQLEARSRRKAEHPERSRRVKAASRRSRRSRSLRRSASGSAQSQSEPDSSAKRHSRKCKICNHPERELIEADFIEWRHPGEIADTYRVAYDVLYRHATANGLFELRREKVAIVVQKVLEEVEYVQEPSAATILRAVRTLACLDSRGRWTEPPTTHVVVNTTERPAESANPVASSTAPAGALSSSSLTETPSESRSGGEEVSSHPPLVTSHCRSNRKIYEKLEPEVNHT